MPLREFEPSIREQFNALVHIARYPNTPLVRDSIRSGYYGAVNLEQTQRTLLSLRTSYPQLGLGLPLTEGYNPGVFESLISQFGQIRTANQQLLVDLVNEAVTKNDPSLLEHFPTKIPTRQTPETVPEAPASQEEQPPPARPSGPAPADTATAGTGKIQRPQEEMPPREEVTKEASEERPETEQAQPESPQEQPEGPASQQTGQSQQAARPQPGQPKDETIQEAKGGEPKQEEPKTQGRGRIKSLRDEFNRRRKNAAASLLRPKTTPGSGGLLNALNNYWGLRDLVSAGKWLADKLGLKSLSNLLGKFFSPEKWLGQLAKGALNLGLQFGRAALNTLAQGALSFASSSLLSSALAAGRLLLTGVAVVAAGITSLPAFLIIIISSFFVGFVLWYTDAYGECGQPGVVEMTKSTNKEAVSVDENIEFKINVVYKIKCPRAYASAVVRDTIPANATYVPGSAKHFLPILGGIGDFSTQMSEGKLDGNTLIWQLNDLAPNEVNTLTFSVTPTQDDVWISNQATIGYQVYNGGFLAGGKIIDSQSRSFQETVAKAAEMNGMPPALMKAILAVEAPGSLRYSEEEFLKFSQPGWWEGLEDSHPDIERGYAYNSCLRNGCAPLDVRGVAQFELGTWNGIVPQLKFSDGHTPDRRNATDSIYGSALFNRQNAEKYIVGSSNVEWTEDVVKAMGRVYCAGPGAATDPSRIANDQCRNYDNLLWDRYRQFLGQP